MAGSRRSSLVLRSLVAGALVGGMTLPGVLVPGADARSRTFTIRGRGWGHGLGMSQWGAKGLADRGWSAEQILGRYYTGTKVESKTTPAEIRVGLFQEQSDVKVGGDGQFDLLDSSGKKRATVSEGVTVRIARSAKDTLTVYTEDGKGLFTSGAKVGVRYEAQKTLVELSRTSGAYRRGKIDIELNPSSQKVRGVIVLTFESYLYGVAEVPSSWPTEALEAQAIAARTYALEKVLRLGQNRPTCNCGVYSTTVDQVYIGAAQEVQRWKDAVNDTKGRVVTYGGKPIQAMYSSSSGGYTENNETSGGSALPYLRGVCDPGDYASGANPNANWEVKLDGAEVDRRLKSAGYDVGTVQKIEILSPRGVSGRAGKVIDETHGGARVMGSSRTAHLSGNALRSALGLKSTLISYRIYGGIRTRYDQLNCGPGLPTSEEYAWKDLDGTDRGRAQNFAKGRLFWNKDTKKVFWTMGAILARYDSLRKAGTDLGLPTSDEFGVSSGRRSNFERGYITWDAQTGKTSVVVSG